jgi:hypothetical protein
VPGAAAESADDDAEASAPDDEPPVPTLVVGFSCVVVVGCEPWEAAAMSTKTATIPVTTVRRCADQSVRIHSRTKPTGKKNTRKRTTAVVRRYHGT